MVYLRDIVGHDPYTGEDILKTGERVNRRLPTVNVDQRDLSKVDVAQRNQELRDLREYIGDAAFEKYMSDLQTKKDIQNAQYQKTWQGEAADAIDGGMTALAFHPTTQPAADIYFALRGAKELSEGNPYGAIGMVPIVGKSLPEIRNIAKQIYFSDNPNAQYLRYIGGKLKYGFDAQFPDLYRRYSVLPDMSQKYTTVSPIKSRFAYESGDVSPLISNFTTDYPVLPIKPSKRGTFTKAAKQHGMSVQGFANKVLRNPSKYSAAMRKKANFAHNASKWNK